MHRILYVVLIVIMSCFIMHFVKDEKNKGDQSINVCFISIILWKDAFVFGNFAFCDYISMTYRSVKAPKKTSMS